MNTRKQPSALRSVLAIALLVLGTGLHAQVLIGTDGGTTVLPSNTISWSVGEPIIGTAATTNGAMTQGYQQPTGKLIYYSRATGNVNDPIWSRTPTGPAGPANFIPRASMVVQAGHVVTNTATVELRDVLVEDGGNLQLAPGSFFNIHGRNATFIGVLYGSDNSVMATAQLRGHHGSLGSGASGGELHGQPQGGALHPRWCHQLAFAGQPHRQPDHPALEGRFLHGRFPRVALPQFRQPRGQRHPVA
ncbi:MAG: hypothetical protein IPO05_07860 [Flavobacteriales bacterium]|nr:hypothetical protein [Flavobacteriales bacterium]